MMLKSEEQQSVYKDLRQALLASFSHVDDLEMMLQDYVSSTLTIPNADNYPLQVFKLIKHIASEGGLTDLVIGASQAKPGNPTLKQFVKKHLESLLREESVIPPSIDSLLTDLIQTVQPIHDFTQTVWSACTQTKPELENDLQRKAILTNEALSADVKWLFLLKLFLDWGYTPDKRLSLVTFLQNLQHLTKGAIKSGLSHWLGQLPVDLQPPSPRASSERPPKVQPDTAVPEEAASSNAPFIKKMGELLGQLHRTELKRLMLVVEMPAERRPGDDAPAGCMINEMLEWAEGKPDRLRVLYSEAHAFIEQSP